MPSARPAARDMGKPAGSFTVFLGEELKARLVAAARRAGTSPSALARQSIAEALRLRNGEDHGSALAVSPGETMKEFRVTVPTSTAARLGAAARAAGVTRSAYVSAAAIGLAERSERRPGTREQPAGIEAAGALREALVKSNATLAPIGRNLNQVTRALNLHPGQSSKADRESLAEVAHRVLQHLELASELLHAIRALRIRAVR